MSRADRAVRSIRGRLGNVHPDVAIVLGSGLGALAEALSNAREIPFGEIEGFPQATVRGHAGRFMTGSISGRDVALMAGRFHLYEGHEAAVAALPVRVVHALGARTLIVSNAAGAIRNDLRTGDLMLIADHINLMWESPLTGAVAPRESRFPDMSSPYDPELLQTLRVSALAVREPVREGVYCALRGPSYETPAEIRMLRRLGADAVGMSTVPEVIVARAFGMAVAGVSCIANAAAGLGIVPLDHAEVLLAMQGASARFVALISETLRRLQ